MQQLKNALEEVGHCLAQFHFRLLVRLDVSVGWLSIDDLGVEKISCILECCWDFPKFYYKNHVEFVEPISSATSCADFQNPKLNKCRQESDPPVFHSSFQTSQNRRSVETKPSHPQCRYPFDSRGYGHEQHGDFQPSNIYYEERTNVVTFIDATDSGFFFLVAAIQKCKNVEGCRFALAT